MEFELVEETQSDNANNDNYTTKYNNSSTYFCQHYGKSFVVRIDYFRDNNRSGNEFKMSMFTNNGWVLVGNQKTIPFNNEGLNDYYKIKAQSEKWIDTCQDYFTKISGVI